MSSHNVPDFGGRRFEHEGHVFEVIPLAGEPISVLYKDAQAWAVREVLPHGVWYGGSVALGAEPLDIELADRVFRHAT
jgi:hypothetical protein